MEGIYFMQGLKPETTGSIAQVGINRDKSFGLSTGGSAHWKYEGGRWNLWVVAKQWTVMCRRGWAQFLGYFGHLECAQTGSRVCHSPVIQALQL